MVDALASGASTGNGVEVRVLFWAPLFPITEHLQRFTPLGEAVFAHLSTLRRYHEIRALNAGFTDPKECFWAGFADR